jgi:hypothetical protein
MSTTLQTRVRVPDDVVFREVAGESMILHLATGIYFGLDLVGTRVWQLLTEHHAVGVVCDAMTREFDASAETIQADVLKLVDQLLAKKLLAADA